MSSIISLKSTGEVGYQRVRPLIEKVNGKLRAVAVAIGTEYRKLPDTEKAILVERLGWTLGRISEFSFVAENYPKKEAVLRAARTSPMLAG